jgi:hypothetical protein
MSYNRTDYPRNRIKNIFHTAKKIQLLNTKSSVKKENYSYYLNLKINIKHYFLFIYVRQVNVMLNLF